jgi:hypothetical protein
MRKGDESEQIRQIGRARNPVTSMLEGENRVKPDRGWSRGGPMW